VSTEATSQPTLTIESDARRPGSRCVGVRFLHPDVIASLRERLQAGRLPRSIFRVRVAGAGASEGEDVPDVFGRDEVLEDVVRFIPHFPFEPGVRFRATFDPRPLGRPAFSDVLTLEFSLPRETSAAPAQVWHVFPSGDALPENLLRFYVCFSNSMQRGQAEKHITLLDPDGRPVPDTLYRPPVELWDGSMRHLTILLDPGRLKRGVGPNRELGPPLTRGQEYTLAIGSGMVDLSGRPLRESFCKSFRVVEAERQPVAVEAWKILRPATGSHQPLALMFPKPLDWALLWHAITIAAESGRPIDGGIAIDQGERRWSLTPTSPWTAGLYHVRVASSLEDVCGNNLLGAFDRPLRSPGDLAHEAVNRSIPFRLP
jgi:hypothetical protein